MPLRGLGLGILGITVGLGRTTVSARIGAKIAGLLSLGWAFDVVQVFQLPDADVQLFT